MSRTILQLTPKATEEGQKHAIMDARLNFTGKGILAYMFLMPANKFGYQILARQARVQEQDFAVEVYRLEQLGYVTIDPFEPEWWDD